MVLKKSILQILAIHNQTRRPQKMMNPKNSNNKKYNPTTQKKLRKKEKETKNYY